MKRTLKLMSVCCLMAAIVPYAESLGADRVVTKASTYTVTQDSVSYRVTPDDSTAYVYGLSDTSVKEINIVGNITYDDVSYPVTYIRSSAFYDKDSLRKVTIEDGITEIQNDAFSYCDNLTEIKLPSTLTTLGTYCFYCSGLESIDIPEGVTEIPQSCVSRCYSLSKVSLPSTLTTLGTYCFDYSAFDSIILPASVTSIGAQAFIGNDNLRYVQCDATTPPTLANSNAFPDYFYTVYVPEGSAEAYYNATNWSSMTIIDGEPLCLTLDVTTGGTLADLILANTENYRDVNELILTGSPNSTDLSTITNRLTKLLRLDLSGTDLTSIPSKFLENRYNIEHVILPDSLATMGTYAFYNCYNLRDVTLPGSLSQVPEYAFHYCYKLEEVNFNEGLKYIGYEAFCNNYSISNLTFPSTLQEIDSRAFYGATGLTELNLNEGLFQIGYSAFDNATSLTSIVCPSTLLKIEDYAFKGCTALQTVEFNEGLMSLWYLCFYGCTALTEITLPSTLQIVSQPFYNCSSVTSITCKAAVPPYSDGGYDLLYNVTKEGIILYVPSILITEYKQADGWDEFINIKPIDGYEPDVIYVKDEMLFTSDVRPTNNPDVYLLDHNYIEGDYSVSGYWNAGKMTVDAGSTFSMGQYEMETRREKYNYNYYDARYSSLVTNSQMRADSVKVSMSCYNNQWHFISLPFDVKVSDIVADDNCVQWVIRSYSGANRAAALTDSTWVNMTADSTLTAGRGYILMTDGDGNYSDIHFKAVNNTNKNNIFAYSDQTVTLNEYLAEYSHNRSWNLVGNPFPCFYDSRYMEFSAPITVWNGTGYTAYSLTDDSYVLKPFEAFFVQKPVEDGEMVFTTDGRQQTVTAGDGPSSSSTKVNSATTRYVLNLTVSGNDYDDRTRVVINDKASVNYEMTTDASKFMSSNKAVPQIYSIQTDGKYAINERPMDEGTVDLGLYAGVSGDYTIALSEQSSLDVILTDKYTDKSCCLNNSEFSFTSDAGTFDDRFTLSFSAEATSISNIVESDDIRISGIDGGLSITSDGITTIEVYSTTGVLVGAANTSAATFNLGEGVYIVNANGKSYKIVVK